MTARRSCRRGGAAPAAPSRRRTSTQPLQRSAPGSANDGSVRAKPRAASGRLAPAPPLTTRRRRCSTVATTVAAAVACAVQFVTATRTSPPATVVRPRVQERRTSRSRPSPAAASASGAGAGSAAGRVVVHRRRPDARRRRRRTRRRASSGTPSRAVAVAGRLTQKAPGSSARVSTTSKSAALHPRKRAQRVVVPARVRRAADEPGGRRCRRKSCRTSSGPQDDLHLGREAENVEIGLQADAQAHRRQAGVRRGTGEVGRRPDVGALRLGTVKRRAWSNLAPTTTSS